MLSKEVRCPYKFCGESFELKEEMLSYTKVGRICFCPKCHNKILFTIPHVPQHKEHMSKKERLRRRRAIEKENRMAIITKDFANGLDKAIINVAKEAL